MSALRHFKVQYYIIDQFTTLSNYFKNDAIITSFVDIIRIHDMHIFHFVYSASFCAITTIPYIMYYNLAVAVITLSCCVLPFYSKDITCYSLLTNEPINKSSGEVIHCSNFSLYFIQNATICWPDQNGGNTDGYTYVDWYSHITATIEAYSSSYSFYSLFYGTWTIPVLQLNEDLSYNFMNSKHSLLYSSRVMAHSLLEFLQYAQWTRVAVITSMTNGLYLHCVNHFYHNFRSSFKVHTQILEYETDIERSLKKIQELKFRIIIVSLPMNVLEEVMCTRLSLGMTWPDYVWLVLNFGDEILLETPCIDKIIVFHHYVNLSLSHTKVQLDYNKLVDIF